MQQTGRLPILVICGRRIGISANMDPRYREPDRREVMISCDRSDLTRMLVPVFLHRTKVTLCDQSLSMISRSATKEIAACARQLCILTAHTWPRSTGRRQRHCDSTPPAVGTQQTRMQYTMLYEGETSQYVWMEPKMHRACEISQHSGITMVRRAVHFSTETNMSPREKTICSASHRKIRPGVCRGNDHLSIDDLDEQSTYPLCSLTSLLDFLQLNRYAGQLSSHHASHGKYLRRRDQGVPNPHAHPQ
jgi:hypothetical protein